jgi:orotate phosphoribosyltransferase
MENARQQLLRLLASLSFKLGHFKLTSGGTSDYYVDCRLTTLHAEGARHTARAVLDEIERHGWHPEAIGGMTLGADPIVTAVAMLTAQLQQAGATGKLQSPGPGLIHGFLVRKAEKAHGMGQRLEGFRKPGARAVIVDDVCTTGASTIAAIEAMQEAGMIVAAVVCIVEREEAAGRPAVEAAAKNAPFLRLFTANEVRAEHVKQLAAARS